MSRSSWGKREGVVLPMEKATCGKAETLVREQGGAQVWNGRVAAFLDLQLVLSRRGGREKPLGFTGRASWTVTSPVGRHLQSLLCSRIPRWVVYVGWHLAVCRGTWQGTQPCMGARAAASGQDFTQGMVCRRTVAEVGHDFGVT